MQSKLCPFCGRRSYSAGGDRWVCPYCGRDISHVPVEKKEGSGQGAVSNIMSNHVE